MKWIRNLLRSLPKFNFAVRNQWLLSFTAATDENWVTNVFHCRRIAKRFAFVQRLIYWNETSKENQNPIHCDGNFYVQSKIHSTILFIAIVLAVDAILISSCKTFIIVSVIPVLSITFEIYDYLTKKAMKAIIHTWVYFTDQNTFSKVSPSILL